MINIESRIRIKLKADNIITLTQKTRDDLASFFNCEDKIIFISNSVILEKSNEFFDEELFLRNKIILGILDKKHFVLFK